MIVEVEYLANNSFAPSVVFSDSASGGVEIAIARIIITTINKTRKGNATQKKTVGVGGPVLPNITILTTRTQEITQRTDLSKIDNQ